MKRVLALLAVVVVVLLAAPASLAAAAPDDLNTTLSWRQLGLGTSIQLADANVSQSIRVPGPEGAAPATLTGTVASAVNSGNAFIEFSRGDDTIIGTVPIPDFGPNQRSIGFSAPLNGIAVEKGRADIRATLRQPGADEICGPVPEVTLTRLNVAYTGDSTPSTTIDNFFAPVLQRVTIYVPTDPTAAAQQAALNIVATVTDRYRPQRVDVRVATADGTPPAAGPLDRSILIRQNDTTAGVWLAEPGTTTAHIVVSGTDSTLPTQVALFRNKLTSLAQTTSATVTEADSAGSVQGSNTVTFGSFSENLSTEVLGTTTLVPGFDPTLLSLGRPGRVKIHLVARYTPVKQNERANLLAVSGSEVLATHALDESGSLDTDFTMPAPQVAANAPLEFRISYEPAPGACNPRSVPLTFQIDPASTASAEETPVRMGGFSSAPLGWQPTLQVAMDGTDPDQLADAAAVLVSVQRSSATPLMPILVDMDQALGSGSGALIVADAAHAAALNPPLNTVDGATSLDLPQRVRVQIPQGLGTIQAFAQNSRTVVLVSTSGNWNLVDPIYTFLDDSEGELADLRGDVLVAGAAGDTELLTIRSDGPTSLVDDAGNAWKIWLGFSALLLAIVAAGVVAYTSVRRRAARRGAASDQPGDLSSE